MSADKLTKAQKSLLVRCAQDHVGCPGTSLNGEWQFGTADASISALERRGLIEKSGGRLIATPAGRAALEQTP